MVLASSAGFTAVVAQAGHKIPVLAMVRSVPAGAVVTAGDLREVRLGVGDAAGYVVPAAEKDQVVGETATVPLVAGALLAPHQVGTRAGYPPVGKAQVAFAVPPGGLPAGLSAGQRVAVVPAATEQSGDAGKDEPDVALVATVTDVAAADRDDAGTVVTVLIDTAAAGRAARIDKPHLIVLSPASREVP